MLTTAVGASSACAQASLWPWAGSWDGGRRPDYWQGSPRQNYWPPRVPRYQDRAQRRHIPQPVERSGKADKQDVVVARKASGPIIAIVSIGSQRINVYGSEGLIAHSVVSTGQSGYRTPTGVFSVIQKARYHESNIYSGAPMPFMHRITWSGIALHAGVVPGYPASHGCIRMTYNFAPHLWGMSKVGNRVIVSPHEATPIDIVDPHLPVPVMTPASPSVAETSREQGPAVHAEAAVENKATAQPVTLSDKTRVVEQFAVASARLDGPLERAKARRAKANADAAAAEKAIRPAFDLARSKAVEANAAATALRKAKVALAAAEARHTAATQAAAGTDATDAQKETAKAASEALDTAFKEFTEAKANEAAKSDESFAAALAAKAAVTAKEETAEALKIAAVGLDPISVFVSRKEGKVYVRQGFTPLFEEPVAIADPDLPLGTHVFTAMSSDDGGATLHWTVVSVLDAGASLIPSKSNKRSQHDEAHLVHAAHPSNAAEALSRIEIPEDLRKEIADRTFVGASLIVSDQGPSNETGRGTDFVILTKQ